MQENTFNFKSGGSPWGGVTGLHIDDIETLQYIKDNLKCGHISKSGNRVNYFVNDINSLINVIIPVFTNFSLNKVSFMLFKKAQQRINFIYQGKLDILKIYVR